VDIVDLDILFQIPKKYARIIGGKREGASSRGSTMEEREILKNTLRTLKNCWGRSLFYSKSKYGRWGKFTGKTGGNPVSSGSTPALPMHSPVSTRPAPENLPKMVSGEESVRIRPCAGAPGVQPGHAGLKLASRCTSRSRRVETGLPVKIPVHTGFAPIGKTRKMKR
jgi:hypothetical protein